MFRSEPRSSTVITSNFPDFALFDFTSRRCSLWAKRARVAWKMQTIEIYSYIRSVLSDLTSGQPFSRLGPKQIKMVDKVRCRFLEISYASKRNFCSVVEIIGCYFTKKKKKNAAISFSLLVKLASGQCQYWLVRAMLYHSALFSTHTPSLLSIIWAETHAWIFWGLRSLDLSGVLPLDDLQLNLWGWEGLKHPPAGCRSRSNISFPSFPFFVSLLYICLCVLFLPLFPLHPLTAAVSMTVPTDEVSVEISSCGQGHTAAVLCCRLAHEVSVFLRTRHGWARQERCAPPGEGGFSEPVCVKCVAWAGAANTTVSDEWKWFLFCLS